jgi:CRISPR-associated exonuclease Cas4
MSEEGSEDILIPVSALNQYGYCPRRCALIHLEQTFEDNVFTKRGTALHERTDDPGASMQEYGIRVERALPLWSTRLGLIGKADVVEFHGDIPYPVEYKSGARRQWDNDDLQLCAQALCLEEMTGQEISCGAIYHFKSRRRREVVFTQELREAVAQAVQDIREMLLMKILPPPVHDKRCEKCSLQESCMPELVSEQRRAKALLQDLFSITEK